jgi:predicted ArsR family transcriptional regulator
MVMSDLDRMELSHGILCTLAGNNRSMIASELARALAVGQRDVVGRLQALKRRGMVSFERDAAQPYGAGHWRISEQGRQAIDPTATGSGKAPATGTEGRRAGER